ncbi:hypothetical protein Acid7E03_24300 [Acidisoma sp. 7E03]
METRLAFKPDRDPGGNDFPQRLSGGERVRTFVAFTTNGGPFRKLVWDKRLSEKVAMLERRGAAAARLADQVRGRRYIKVAE